MSAVLDGGGYRLTDADRAILVQAAEVHERTMCARGVALSDPMATRRYFRDLIGGRRREVFVVMYLDNQHRIIETREEFRGTINSAMVYPREIVRKALELGAKAVIFAHNHPSGEPEPSAPDRDLTQRLKDALALVDIRVLDHIIIGLGEGVSFAERGLL